MDIKNNAFFFLHLFRLLFAVDGDTVAAVNIIESSNREVKYHRFTSNKKQKKNKRFFFF